MKKTSVEENFTEKPTMKDPREGYTRRNMICLGILFFTNLINYMDRYTVSAVLESISKEVCLPERCSTTQEGLIQTAFVLVYFVVAPIFGYLGDRYSRKYIMAAGVLVWGGTSLSASFMTSYWPFLTLRALIAVGESAFTTIAPTVLGDLFNEETRSLVLGLFYLAIPFGSGLGYVVGRAPEDWHNGLRITPGLNFLAVILILFFVVDPPRGLNEKEERDSSFVEDVFYLMKIKSFLLNVAGFTCVTFTTGALSWFGPTYVSHDDLIVAFVFVFFGTTFLNMNWSISVDMSLYVVIPTRRSAAEAIHLMATHALGEAGSPYIIGSVSDAIIEDICPDLSCDDIELAKYLGLQRAMYLAFALLFTGGVLYCLAVIWIKPEKEKVDRYLEAELAKYSEVVALKAK